MAAFAVAAGPIGVSPAADAAGTAQGVDPAATTPLVRVAFPREDGPLTPYGFELGYPLVTLAYDTLLWRDESGVPRPWLARDVETSADGLRVAIRLVDDARWHDGNPVTAHDVAFTFRYVAERPHPRFTPQLTAVERVDVADDRTAVVTLRHRSPGFVDQPLADVPILPAHLWSSVPAGRSSPPGLAIGSGPYRLVEHRPGAGYRFEANPAYFRGRPTVDAIEVGLIDDVYATVTALERGDVDMVAVSLPEELARQVAGRGMGVARGPSFLGTVLVLNTRVPPFDAVGARRAVAAAVDPRRSARAAGGGVPATRGYVHPASRWAPTEPVTAGAAGGAPAASAPAGPVEVLVPDNEPGRLEAGRHVAGALRRAGIEAVAVPVTAADLARAVGEDGSVPSFQAAVWTAPPLASYDPDFLSRVFGSDARTSPLNYSGYLSAEFDQLAQRVATATPAAARRTAVRDALELLARDVPVVPLHFDDGAYAYRPSAYDGWVYVKGAGILDKRSFLPSARRRDATGPVGGAGPGGAGLSALSVAGVALIVGALAVGGAAVLRRRR